MSFFFVFLLLQINTIMHRILLSISFIISLGILSFSSCSYAKVKPSASAKNATNIVIAITKAHGSRGYRQYTKWIQHFDSSIVIYDLYGLSTDSINTILPTIDGLLVSGGPDVNPHLYHGDSLAFECETPDNYRDSIELQSIDYSYKHQLAILGICRGQQIINVYFGGSLYSNLPTQHPSNIIHRRKDTIAYHSIHIVPKTFLYALYSVDTAWVNSAHHQAIRRLGQGLIIDAYAPDNIIESISLKNQNYPNFFLGVQFHPEHLGFNNELANSIGKNFIGSAKIIHSSKEQ